MALLEPQPDPRMHRLPGGKHENEVQAGRARARGGALGRARGRAGLSEQAGPHRGDVPAGRLERRHGARALGSAAEGARPAGRGRQQAGRRRHHRGDRNLPRRARRLQSADVEHDADLAGAVHARSAALRFDQGLHPRRAGRDRPRRGDGASVRAGQEPGRAGRLDQGAGQEGVLRLGRRRLDRPHSRRDLQEADRAQHRARRLPRQRADDHRPDRRPAELLVRHAAAERAAHQSREAAPARRDVARALACRARHSDRDRGGHAVSCWRRTSSASRRRPSCRPPC